MPKMKSHSSSTKRFKRLGNGKIKRTKAFKRHHAWAKTAKQIRNLRTGVILTGANEKNITKLLP